MIIVPCRLVLEPVVRAWEHVEAGGEALHARREDGEFAGLGLSDKTLRAHNVAVLDLLMLLVEIPVLVKMTSINCFLIFTNESDYENESKSIYKCGRA